MHLQGQPRLVARQSAAGDQLLDIGTVSRQLLGQLVGLARLRRLLDQPDASFQPAQRGDQHRCRHIGGDVGHAMRQRSDVALQLPWHGKKLTPDNWRLIFLDALKREAQLVPNIDGTGFVNIGASSSDLTKEEMGDCMTIIEEFGARHGVKFQDDARAA